MENTVISANQSTDNTIPNSEVEGPNGYSEETQAVDTAMEHKSITKNKSEAEIGSANGSRTNLASRESKSQLPTGSQQNLHDQPSSQKMGSKHSLTEETVIRKNEPIKSQELVKEPLKHPNDSISKEKPKHETEQKREIGAEKEPASNTQENYAKPSKERKSKKQELKTDYDPLTMVAPPSPELEENKKRTSNLKDLFPYRHYPSIHPVSNKLLAMKWDMQERTQLKKKLQNVRPTVDIKVKQTFSHLKNKSKKLEMEREKKKEIQRNNRIMLERISKIVYKEAHNSEMSRKNVAKLPHLIHSPTRARESKRISADNEKLMHRILNQKPLYNHHLLIGDRVKNLAYLENISSFPQRFKEEREKLVQMKPRKQDEKAIEKRYEEIHARFAEAKQKHDVLPAIRPKTRDHPIPVGLEGAVF